MPIGVTSKDESLTLTLQTALSGGECDALRRTISENLQSQTRTVYLDLRGLDFIDSTGLGALVGAKVTCTRHGARVILLSPSPKVMRILLGANFDIVFDIMDAVEA